MDFFRYASRGLRCIAAISTLFTVLFTAACQDLTADLPAGAVDPRTYATPEAAAEMARNARYEFQRYQFDVIVDAGRITDELTFPLNTAMVPGMFTAEIVLDQRHLPDQTLQRTPIGDTISDIRSYKGLQRVRSLARLARGALVAYAPESPPAFRGEMFAYEAYAEVLLADLFCSGIPLSTVDFNGDYTYQPGSPTADVYAHAVTLFDSAIALSTGDPSIHSLAMVGKGRTLLAMGRYPDAGEAVSDVPAGFRFELPVLGYLGKVSSNVNGSPWGSISGQPILTAELSRMIVANAKGQIGLPFASSLDPRIPLSRAQPSAPDQFPQRRETYVIANYVEAQLIHAEALLQAGNAGWLPVLNALRTTCTSTVGCATPAPAGTGGVAGLPPLSDPGTDTARVSLLFRERAFWLFFTGHRQGDLRRLIRNYGRTIEAVYPRGTHPGGIGFFDQYVDIPIPAAERSNPYYTGCIGRGA